MKTVGSRLRIAVVLMAWFAQLCLPVLHAAVMPMAAAGLPGWCGDPARGLAIAAQLPPEVRDALQLDNAADAEHRIDCAKFCALGSPPPVAEVACTVALRAAGLEPAPAPLTAPRSRDQAPTPPSHGPPAHA
jgi:hypothetical protein